MDAEESTTTLGSASDFLRKIAENRGHLGQGSPCLYMIAAGPGQSIPTLHDFVINCQNAALDSTPTRCMLEEIREDPVVMFEGFVDVVKRDSLSSSLQGFLDLREI
jgi:hypothetical protein